MEWCAESETVLVSNNAKDFEPLHAEYDHAGMFLYYEQNLPDADPEGLARTVDEVFNQYGTDELKNQLVDLGEWYEWLYGWSETGPVVYSSCTERLDMENILS